MLKKENIEKDDDHPIQFLNKKMHDHLRFWKISRTLKIDTKDNNGFNVKNTEEDESHCARKYTMKIQK